MKERRLFLFLTFLPFALAIFFWDLDTRLSNQPLAPATPPAVNEAKLPTTILEKTRLTQYDISGLQSQTVTSERLLSSDFQQIIDIELPVIRLETDEGIWLAESQTGEFNQSENRLSLFGSVTLTQTPIEHEQSDENLQRRLQRPVQMQTEQLDYYPQIRLAETTTAVLIETQGHHIESKGIRIDLANSIYTLRERVRSTHEPM